MSRQKEPKVRFRTSTELFSPAMFAAPSADVLLALFAHERDGLSLGKLAAMCSALPLKFTEQLADLEDRSLITGHSDPTRGEVRAIFTADGRELVRRHLSASSELAFSERE